MDADDLEQRYLKEVLIVIRGESSRNTAAAARELGYALQAQEDEEET